MITTATIIALLTGVIIPFLVDLVTKDVASSSLKAFLATTLAAIAGALATVTYHSGIGWKQYVLNIALAIISTFTTHSTGVTAPVQRATANIGIGPKPVVHTRRQHKIS